MRPLGEEHIETTLKGNVQKNCRLGWEITLVIQLGMKAVTAVGTIQGEMLGSLSTWTLQ